MSLLPANSLSLSSFLLSFLIFIAAAEFEKEFTGRQRLGFESGRGVSGDGPVSKEMAQLVKNKQKDL